MRCLGVITNPYSKKNRGEQGRAGRLGHIVGGRGLVIETRSVAEIEPALRRLADAGADCWVSDGGDGAFHWMVNTALARGIPLPPAVLPANGGTIDFVAKTAGVRGTCEEILGALAEVCAGAPGFPLMEVKSLCLEGETSAGELFERVGFAAAIGGIGQRFFEKYYEHERPGALSILRVVARATASFVGQSVGLHLLWPGWGSYARGIFRPTPARVVIDGEAVAAEAHGAIHAGAISVNLGGVFRVFPLADQADRLHFQAGAIRPLEMIRNLPNLCAGRPIRSARLVEKAGRCMEVAALGGEDLAPVVDGELYGGLRRVTVRPGPRVFVPAVRPRAAQAG